MKLSDLLKQHRDTIATLIYSISRMFGYIGFHSNHIYFRVLMNYIRAGYWSPRFGKVGKCVQIDSGVTIVGNTKKIEIGDYSYIDTNVKLEAYESLKIGKYVHISNSAHIQSGAPIIIGDYANIAAGTRIYAASNTYKTPDCREKQILLSLSTCAPSEMQYVKREPIVIEDYAFIGLNCIILPGIKIGRGAIVGAGTIITKDVKPYTIVYNALSRMEFERPYIP